MNGPKTEERARAAALYAEHHERLHRAVRHAIQTSEQNVEDACSFAWLQLMQTRPDCGERIFAWLKAVAIHEALRLDGRDRRSAPLDDAKSDCLPDRSRLAPDDAADLTDAMHQLARLTPRQRRILGLKVAGFNYAEIGELTGDTYRTIDRQLVRARARIRRRAG